MATGIVLGGGGGRAPFPLPPCILTRCNAQEDKLPATLTDLGEEMVPDM